MRMLLASSLLTLTCLSSGFIFAAEQKPSALEPLLQAISERLTIADQVALSKWDSGKAVEDPPREQQVITAAQARAAEFKLNPEDVQRLFRAQIEANKRVQNALLAQWHAAGKAPDTVRLSLVDDIRPKLPFSIRSPKSRPSFWSATSSNLRPCRATIATHAPSPTVPRNI